MEEVIEEKKDEQMHQIQNDMVQVRWSLNRQKTQGHYRTDLRVHGELSRELQWIHPIVYSGAWSFTGVLSIQQEFTILKGHTDGTKTISIGRP